MFGKKTVAFYHFRRKLDVNLTKTYNNITLTAVAAKIYNKMHLNIIHPLDPFLRNNQN